MSADKDVDAPGRERRARQPRELADAFDGHLREPLPGSADRSRRGAESSTRAPPGGISAPASPSGIPGRTPAASARSQHATTTRRCRAVATSTIGRRSGRTARRRTGLWSYSSLAGDEHRSLARTRSTASVGNHTHITRFMVEPHGPPPRVGRGPQSLAAQQVHGPPWLVVGRGARNQRLALNTPTTNYSSAALRELSMESPELALDELGTYLRLHPNALEQLSPRRFEELVVGLFRANGLDAVHTGRSGDGGADVVLHKNGSLFGIVECKRYRPDRPVGVAYVRSLVGAAVDWGARRAFLVTSSFFTDGVVAKAEDFRKRGYEIGLTDLTQLLKDLKVFNETLPELDRLTSSQRAEIVAANTARLTQFGGCLVARSREARTAEER